MYWMGYRSLLSSDICCTTDPVDSDNVRERAKSNAPNRQKRLFIRLIWGIVIHMCAPPIVLPFCTAVLMTLKFTHDVFLKSKASNIVSSI